MKNQLFSILLLAILTLIACKQPAETEEVSDVATEVEVAAEMPDYAAFDKKVAVINSFVTAHETEDLDALTAVLSDTIKWSPADSYDGSVKGKEDFLVALKGYHGGFENIKFHPGIKMGDLEEGGYWSGSVYPENSASSHPGAVRVYGHWTATHTESQKEIGVKFYAIAWVNDDNQIAQWTDYFDVHGISAQLEEE